MNVMNFNMCGGGSGKDYDIEDTICQLLAQDRKINIIVIDNYLSIKSDIIKGWLQDAAIKLQRHQKHNPCKLEYTGVTSKGEPINIMFTSVKPSEIGYRSEFRQADYVFINEVNEGMSIVDLVTYLSMSVKSLNIFYTPTGSKTNFEIVQLLSMRRKDLNSPSGETLLGMEFNFKRKPMRSDIQALTHADSVKKRAPLQYVNQVLGYITI